MLRLTVIAGMVALAGCGGGPTLHPVHGRVQFSDGTPVRGGTIEFRSTTEHVSAIGQIQPDGRFELSTRDPGDGARAGRHQVIIVQSAIPLGNAVAHEHGPRVPKKYSDYATSNLEVEVQGNSQNEPTIVIEN